MHGQWFSLTDHLEKNGYKKANIAYCLLYISDMTLFAQINAVYTKYYGINPPPRYGKNSFTYPSPSRHNA